MSITALHDGVDGLPVPQGHMIGFVDSSTQRDAVIQALIHHGFEDSSIVVLSGDEGMPLFKRIMAGASWGEEAENAMRQGMVELSHGHFCLIVECEDRDQAMVAARMATGLGGHGFSHFGILTDERLTK